MEWARTGKKSYGKREYEDKGMREERTKLEPNYLEWTRTGKELWKEGIRRERKEDGTGGKNQVGAKLLGMVKDWR